MVEWIFAVAKSVGNMVTMRGKKDPCVCVCVCRIEKRAALELICPSSNDLPRTHLDGSRFHQSLIDPRKNEKRGEKRVWSKVGITIV